MDACARLCLGGIRYLYGQTNSEIEVCNATKCAKVDIIFASSFYQGLIREPHQRELNKNRFIE